MRSPRPPRRSEMAAVRDSQARDDAPATVGRATARVSAFPTHSAANLAWEWSGRHLRPWLLGAVSLGAALLVWHLLTRYRVVAYVRFTNIPSPGAVFEQFLMA